MSQKDVGNKIPIYKLKKTDEVMKYYDDWGQENKYDKDMLDWNYTGPKETTETFDATSAYADDSVVQSDLKSMKQSAVKMSVGQKHQASQILKDWLDDGNKEDSENNEQVEESN